MGLAGVGDALVGHRLAEGPAAPPGLGEVTAAARQVEVEAEPPTGNRSVGGLAMS